MGNCLRQQVAPTVLDSAVDKGLNGRRNQDEEDEKKAEAPTVQVKIVITRRQLEELVSHGDLQSLLVHKLLSHEIMSMKTLRNVRTEKKIRWRPTLQRIAEVS